MSDNGTPTVGTGGDGPSGPAAYRLSDQERDEAIAALAQAYAEGRLSVEEFEERMTHAGSARLATDLDSLFADLPGRPRQRSSGRAQVETPGRRPGGSGYPAGERRPVTWSSSRQARPSHPPALLPVLAVALVAVVVTGKFWVLFPILFLGAHLTGARTWGMGCQSKRRGSQRW